ncbi:phage tail tape measure protein [Arthrobacter sp. 260]|uniref:phage tail tape measure protein n=1 Tax=Arthrobacter sp. 260 TaxID=2735314 RepID=UPI0014931456|nr:phage tail tape measure protein [Arthrobacter sp. 260]
MADRNVVVRLTAEIAGFKQAMDEATRVTKQTQKATEDAGKSADTNLGRMVQSAQKNRQAWDQTGATFLKTGAVIGGGLAMVTKAAVSWESAWAGVQKTTDGSPEQMAALEKELRGLAKTLPATHEEIAGVAEAAGQLGIQRENVASFTKTMVDLGESTNLSSEEAATGLARFSNVMGTSQDDVSRLGSTLVGLGNNFATTESEILAMSMRLSGAGVQAGLSEGEVMGLAAAMSSVGIEAEAGGSAMSITMKRISKAVEEGGGSLDLFAKTSGMTSEQFSTAWENDAAGALTTFVAGLSETEAMGMSTNAVLTELGITGIREADALLRLSSAHEVTTAAMAQGNEEFARNTALQEEAAKRYETTESKIKIAWNNIKDAAIEGGAVILPVIAGLAEGVADMAEFFGNLPGPVKGAMTGIAGIAGVGALAAGAFLTLFHRVMDTVGAFKTLSADAPRAASALGKVGKAAGVAAVIGGVVTALAKWSESSYMADIDTGMGKVSDALADITTDAPGAATALDSLFQDRNGGDLIGNVDDLGSAIDRTFNKTAGRKFNDWAEGIISSIVPVEGSSHILADSWKRLDQGLSDLVTSGNLAGADDAFKSIQEQAEAQGVSLEELSAKFPQYADALATASAEQKEAASSAEATEAALEQEAAAAEEAAVASAEMEEALAEIGLSADGTIASLNTFIGVLQESGLLTLSARDASRNFEAAIDSIQPAIDALIEKHGGLGEVLNDTASGFRDDTEAGREAGSAFDAVASSGANMAQAMADAGGTQEELQAQLGTTYGSLINAAGQFGITGEAADLLARDVMGIPAEANIETWMSDEALKRAEATTAAMDNIPGEVDVHSFMSSDANDMALNTKASAEDVPDQVTIDSWMSDAAFIEALETRAAALNIPPDVAVASFMSSAARNEADSTTAQVLNIPAGTSISSYMDAYARYEAQNLNAELDRANGRVVTSYMDVITRRSVVDMGGGAALKPGQIGRIATGGRVRAPSFADGGRLPATGLGTDKILGISSMTGGPTAWVDDREWVINRPMSDKWDVLLAAINRDDPRLSSIPALAGGGRMSREYPAAPAYAGGSGSMTATVETAAIAAAVSSAVAGMRPMVNIGGREFYGLMQQTNRDNGGI